MKDEFHTRALSAPGMPDRAVRDVAYRDRPAAAPLGGAAAEVLDTARLLDLCEAFLHEDENYRHDLLRQLQEDGAPVSDIIDHVIPEIARCFGAMWDEDRISFADVTIGTARLQEAVRGLGAGGRTARLKNRLRPDAPRVLMVVPQGEMHTLGVFVAADALLRRGIAVDIALGQPPKDVARQAAQGRYGMIAVTISSRRTLAYATALVDKMKSSTTYHMPIVVGGNILDTELDVKSSTGADYVAETIESALLQCALDTAPTQAGATWVADRVS